MRNWSRRLWGVAVSGITLAISLIMVIPFLHGTTVLAPEPTPDQATRAPRPTAIEVGASDRSAVVSWHVPGVADAAAVEWSPDETFEPFHSQSADSTLTILDGLEPETTYHLRVRIQLEDETSVSDPVTFTTTDERFLLKTPKLNVDSKTSTSLETSWTKAPKRFRYEVQLATNKKFRKAKTFKAKEPKRTITELDKDATYYARVRVVDRLGTPHSDWSKVVAGETATYLPLRVGTYNIQKHSQADWSKRRMPVAQMITSQKLAVVGLQEAVPSHYKGRRQYNDVDQLLGPNWALTDYSKKSGEARTAYDKRQVKLIRNGAHAISGSASFGTQRYVTWAVFEQLANQKRFLFLNTHFANKQTPKGKTHRISAANQLVATVRRVNTENLPVIIVGDFNTGQRRTSANGVYRVITGAGYHDPLKPGVELGSAQKKIRANLRTANRLRRKAPTSPAPSVQDHIFVSSMKVAEWETVAKLDSSGRFIGTIPSDHNLVRATVHLP